jgi:hypothetical protein
MLPVVTQLPKSILVALLSMPVGTRVLTVILIVFFIVGSATSRQGLQDLLGLQPYHALFQLQCLFT